MLKLINRTLDTFHFFIYRCIAYPFAYYLLHISKIFLPKKIKQLIDDRKENSWMSLPTKPIWIHAASGEIEYAKDLIRRLKTEYPQVPILVSYFSPSAKKIIKNILEIDFSTPLPWDRKKDVLDFINFYQPRLALFARGDLWPELAEQLAEKNIPTCVFSVSCSDLQTDRNYFYISLYRKNLNLVDKIFCISENDKHNLKKLGIESDIEVAGDTRYDQVVFRVQNPKPLRFAYDKSDHKVLICGSTWAEDNEILLQVFNDFLKDPLARVIWAPPRNR